MPTLHRQTAGSLLVATLLLLAACGGQAAAPEESIAGATDAALTPVALPQLPPGDIEPTEDDPLRVTLLGDSLMGNLSGALVPALDGSEAIEAEFRLAPELPTARPLGPLWRSVIDGDPDLVVMLIGGWEGDVVTADTPGLAVEALVRYQDDVVRPFVNDMTASGAHILWLGSPPVRSPEGTRERDALNQAYAAVATAHPRVTYLDAGDFVSGPDGGWTPSMSEDGEYVRVRSTDGVHLSAAGVERVAEPITHMVERAWDLAVADGWESGPWREESRLPPPEECANDDPAAAADSDRAAGGGVLIAGDSVMRDTSWALIDALDEEEGRSAEFVLRPDLGFNDLERDVWESQLEDFDPAVIVLSVGFWERKRLQSDGTLEEPDWQTGYLATDVEPFIDLITSTGAPVIWVGMPPVAAEESRFFYAVLNEMYRSVAESRPDVTFIDPAATLSDASGDYQEFGTGEDGELVRLRRTDGLHLCPEGVVRVAEPVLDLIRQEAEIDAAPGWQLLDWRHPPTLSDPGECPSADEAGDQGQGSRAQVSRVWSADDQQGAGWVRDIVGRSRAQLQRRALGAVKAGAYRTGLHRLVLPRYEYMFRPRQLCLLCQFLTETNHLGGPILEIGVAGGATTVFLNKHLEDLNSRRAYHCIDTFEGFTEADIAHERERGKAVQPYSEQFRNYNERYLSRTLQNNRVTGVEVHRADVAAFDFGDIDAISFCLIDVDLFAPVAAALEQVLPRMASDGVVVVDDCRPNSDFDGAHEAYVDAVQALGVPVDIRFEKLGVIRVD